MSTVTAVNAIWDTEVYQSIREFPVFTENDTLTAVDADSIHYVRNGVAVTYGVAAETE